MSWRLTSIVSGGQTGVDRGGLEAAMMLDLGWGGWAPSGWRAEDGQIPMRYRARMRQTTSREYGMRTRLNVQDSDGTLIITFTPELTAGTAFTEKTCIAMDKPHLHLVLPDRGNSPIPDEVGESVREWIRNAKINVLNVAGPRESKEPDIQEATCDALVWIFDGDLWQESDDRAYYCAHCSKVCSWSTDQPDPTAEEVKTIGSRYCVHCIDAEASAHGLSRDKIIAKRIRMGQKVPR